MVFFWFSLFGCQDVSVIKLDKEGDSPGECSDGADNDSDDLFDCNDDDCFGSIECSEDTSVHSEIEGDESGECSDGIDNDNDGYIDCNDSGCNEDPDCGSSPNNLAPNPPIVSVHPDRPRNSEDISCQIDTGSTDPEGDTVTYSFLWYKNDIDTGLSSESIAASMTAPGDTWRCEVTPNDGQLDGDPGMDSRIIHPDCLVHMDEDWNSGPSNWSNWTGDWSIQNGEAHMFRTSTEWASATYGLSRLETGAFEMSARLTLLPGNPNFDQSSVVAVCILDSNGTNIEVPGVGIMGDGYCIQLSDSTQDNSIKGAFFLKNDIASSIPSRIKLSQEFDPDKNTSHALNLTRDLDGNFEFFFNGNSLGSINDTAISTFDTLLILGGQNTHAENGGRIDDVYFEGCP